MGGSLDFSQDLNRGFYMYKLIFALLVPLICSCSMKLEFKMFPDQTGERPPSPQIKIKDLADSYRDGTDGWDIIDIPFV